MPKAQMQGKTVKLTDRQRLENAINGDPTKITVQQCCKAAYYVKEEAKKTEHGKIAVALIRTGQLRSFLKLTPGPDTEKAVHLAEMVEHMEGPHGTVTHDCLRESVSIFMAQPGATL